MHYCGIVASGGNRSLERSVGMLRLAIHLSADCMYRPVIVCLLAFGIVLPVFGQADTTVVELPEVTVEATRALETEGSAPFTVSVDTRSDLETSLEAPIFIGDAVRNIPGVWLNDRGHFALGERLVVRGMGWRSPFGVRGVQTLLDGVPLTMPDGQAFLDIVDPVFVRRTEAVRGPSSLFWGNGSGGTLFLDSTPAADAPTAQLRAGVGSHGLQQFAAEAVVRPNGNLWRVAVSDMRRDGFRDNSDGRFTRALLTGRIGLASNTQLNLVGAFVDQDARNPGSLTAEQVAEDRTQANGLFDGFNAGKQSTQGHLGARLTHTEDEMQMDATVYSGFRDLANPLPFNLVEFDRLYGGVRTALSGTLSGVEWNVGADANIQHDDRINFDTNIPEREFTDDVVLDQLETVVSRSAFGYTRIPLTDRLRLTLGGRLDVVDFELDDRLQVDDIDESGERTFSAFSPGVGLAYDTGPALIFANYNTAFETPTTTELVNRPGNPGGFNPELNPQRTRGVELGTRGAWAEASLRFDIAVYQLWVDDRLVQFEIPDSGGRAFFQNVGENTHRGVELAVQWDAQSWLTLETSYTANRIVFEDDDLQGNRVPGVPDQRFSATATAQSNSIWLRLSYDAVDDYFADNQNTAVSDGYALLDMRLGHTGINIAGSTLRPYVEVSNVFDTTYNGSVSINANDNYFEPGMGRSFKAGLTLAL